MDYKDEQNNEIEALDSIYSGEMEILGITPHHKFIIPIKSEEYEPDTDNGLMCKLKFSYAAKYPEEAPEVEICDSENFEEEDEALLKEHIIQQAQENLGTVMIFTLVSSAQEWLNTKWDEVRKRREEYAILKEKEAEEAERRRFEGTRVTVESFLAWKARFDAETGAKTMQDREEKETRKLTGRELFLTDKTLNESDLKFLEDGGDSIKVDESLFQDLEELDLDADEVLDDDSS
ncbi:hypothetical protein Cfor_07715 [Coptotermes formosanus]|uniref:RWD domain-containing protein n=1 Tax=Coptotermes formosanus TaxID=36987 RepID=A0A6L2PPE2_COPFO|nr:hypothetical protein Cfor_07715 [Coptotermes formosanus]